MKGEGDSRKTRRKGPPPAEMESAAPQEEGLHVSPSVRVSEAEAVRAGVAPSFHR